MANGWTPQQEQAIDLHGRNLLVSAAAGSGKTAVLVERIVRMITQEPGVDVDRLLVLTFTRAAANEMRRRFRKQYPDLGKDLLFGTFHAICYQILRTSDTTRTYHLITDTERYHILEKVLLQ